MPGHLISLHWTEKYAPGMLTEQKPGICIVGLSLRVSMLWIAKDIFVLERISPIAPAPPKLPSKPPFPGGQLIIGKVPALLSCKFIDVRGRF